MKTKVSERDVLKSCLQYLAYRKGYYWRNNTGALPFGENRFVRFGLKGSADILGVRPTDGVGQFVAIECKATGGKMSAAQDMFRYEIEKFGGLFVLAYSVDDLVAAGL